MICALAFLKQSVGYQNLSNTTLRTSVKLKVILYSSRGISKTKLIKYQEINSLIHNEKAAWVIRHQVATDLQELGMVL